MLIHVMPQSEIKERRDKVTREIKGLKQEVYADLGQAFPTRIFIQVNDRLSEGKYEMQPCFTVGKFGDLEINPFETPSVKPANPQQIKAAS